MYSLAFVSFSEFEPAPQMDLSHHLQIFTNKTQISITSNPSLITINNN